MPAADFKTVPDELLHVAEALEDYLGNEGYDVAIEDSELGFPFTPTLLARRGHETLIIELATALDQQRLGRWGKYCRSQSSDTRLCATVSYDEAHKAQTAEFCHSHRIGLWTFRDGAIQELRAPVDLAVHIDLPDLRDIKPKVRRFLAGPFKKINSDDWRDGLSDIYMVIEDSARDYLREGIDRTRIVTKKSKNGPALTVAEVDGMTLGQLSYAFANIQSQNQQDSLIASTLAMINPIRVELSHRRLRPAAEAAIRRDFGKHVYAAINCLEEILK
jgi:hypothetical protein